MRTSARGGVSGPSSFRKPSPPPASHGRITGWSEPCGPGRLVSNPGNACLTSGGDPNAAGRNVRCGHSLVGLCRTGRRKRVGVLFPDGPSVLARSRPGGGRPRSSKTVMRIPRTCREDPRGTMASGPKGAPPGLERRNFPGVQERHWATGWTEGGNLPLRHLGCSAVADGEATPPLSAIPGLESCG